MFCPKCKSEYREGYDYCSTCEVPLVAELPSNSALSVEYKEFVEIPLPYSPDIPFLISLLEGDKISYYFNGMIKGDGPRLFVRQDQSEKARDILSYMELCNKEWQENDDE